MKNVLVESTKSKFQVLAHKPANVLKRIKGILSDFGSNRNGRIYPRELWENVINSDYVKEMINSHGLVGELDHPEERLEISLQEVSHVINDMWIEGDKVMGIIDILPTPNGKIVNELLDYGTDIGISSRGAGSVGPDNTVDPDYQFITFDFVARPSCEAARLNTILEGVKVDLENNSADRVSTILESYKSGLNESYSEELISKLENKLLDIEAAIEKKVNSYSKSQEKHHGDNPYSHRLESEIDGLESKQNKYKKYIEELKKDGNNTDLINEINKELGLKLDSNGRFEGQDYVEYVYDWMNERKYWNELDKMGLRVVDYLFNPDLKSQLDMVKALYNDLYDQNGINGELFASYEEWLDNDANLNESTDLDSYTEEEFSKSSDRYKELEKISFKSSGLEGSWSMSSSGNEDTIVYSISDRSSGDTLKQLTYNVDNLGKMSDEEFESLKLKIKSDLGVAISDYKLGVSNKCPMCGKEYIMYVDTNSYLKYVNGEKIQDAFKDLNPMEREFIKSGYCPDCQKQLFGTDYTSDKIITIEDANKLTESVKVVRETYKLDPAYKLNEAMSDQEVYKVVLTWYKDQIESGKMTLNQCYELLSDKAKVSLNKLVDQSKIRESVVSKSIKKLIKEADTPEKVYSEEDQKKLQEIYDNLQKGISYGEDMDKEHHSWITHPYFSEAIYLFTGENNLQEYIGWTHYGRSAGKNTVEDLKWILDHIFNMTPTEFTSKYIKSTDSKIDLTEAEEPYRPNGELDDIKRNMVTDLEVKSPLDLNTGVLPILDTDTYSRQDYIWNPDVYEWDDEADDFKDAPSQEDVDRTMVAYGTPIIENYLKRVLPSASVKGTGVYHPRQYNFSSDELEFTVSFDTKEYLALEENAFNDPEFNDFLRDNYKSYDGFFSYLADNKDEFYQQDGWKRFVQVIMFYLKDKIDESEEEETNATFWEDVVGNC